MDTEVLVLWLNSSTLERVIVPLKRDIDEYIQQVYCVSAEEYIYLVIPVTQRSIEALQEAAWTLEMLIQDREGGGQDLEGGGGGGRGGDV